MPQHKLLILGLLAFVLAGCGSKDTITDPEYLTRVATASFGDGSPGGLPTPGGPPGTTGLYLDDGSILTFTAEASLLSIAAPLREAPQRFDVASLSRQGDRSHRYVPRAQRLIERRCPPKLRLVV